ncbi:leucine-rich repeat and fibronectin type III domain-containing protein 1-like [Bradysia coprophila]|uniref:leucine-rich repeat and fibronectin type III domain-containing protein 1-like n=1 Tax=Bradysia coprophila TaxID=38358 RepID=UPI00187D6FAC|nr:leucine-rich repeat and fibronectin type III domain-containing protein 1-like [Bradysia coprophila]
MKLIQKLSLISLLLGASSFVTEPSDDNLPTVEVSCNNYEHETKLWNLDLNRNKIKSFGPNTFIGCKNVANLYLDDNQLVTIRQNDFVGLTNLKYLCLRRNKIESIEDGALNFTHLTNLYLDNNQLQQLSDHTFTGMPELTYLSIDNNNLARVGSSFQRLTKLQKISLAWNRIVDLNFTALLQMPELTVIYLRSSGLTSINTEYTPGVTYAVDDLDLAHNGIRQSDLLTRLRNCGNLTKLRLSGNSYDKLDELERIGELLPKLRRISVGFQYTYSEAQSMASKSKRYVDISPNDFPDIMYL